ncbi:uncharacterized protein J3D65DRAFT_608214 [Phyllosticta citribraziliensis]|uniref:Uncharacterized protein n=1 Tax=Phyllosticta citribraziliensis TaxID=989973 RepID=A0ABR1M807_9PEZI
MSGSPPPACCCSPCSTTVLFAPPPRCLLFSPNRKRTRTPGVPAGGGPPDGSSSHSGSLSSLAKPASWFSKCRRVCGMDCEDARGAREMVSLVGMGGGPLGTVGRERKAERYLVAHRTPPDQHLVGLEHARGVVAPLPLLVRFAQRLVCCADGSGGGGGRLRFRLGGRGSRSGRHAAAAAACGWRPLACLFVYVCAGKEGWARGGGSVGGQGM